MITQDWQLIPIRILRGCRSCFLSQAFFESVSMCANPWLSRFIRR